MKGITSEKDDLLHESQSKRPKNEPSVLVHKAFGSHSFAPIVAHSSTSTKFKQRLTDKIKQKEKQRPFS